MPPIVAAAVVIITLAFLSYTVATVAHQRTSRVTGLVATFLILGVTFDVTATLCMVAAAGTLRLTTHGALGVTALFTMLIEAVLALRHRARRGAQVPVSRALRLYSRIAYAYWVLAFLSGGTMVMMSRRAARQAALLFF